MEVILDLEANGLTPTKIHIVVCKDIKTGEVYKFYEHTRNDFERFSRTVDLVVGHNIIGYDLPALESVWSVHLGNIRIVDTLVLSRLIDATRSSHSLESWGDELKQKKLHTGITDWSTFTPEMEERCVGDVETNFLLYQHFQRYLVSPLWADSISTEHYIAAFCRRLSINGFAFDYDGAKTLHDRISGEVDILTKGLQTAFLPRPVLVREVLPRATKFGTIAKNSIPKVLGSDLTPYSAEAPFSLLEWQTFNPGSSKQRVERLNEAGWKPQEKTKGHKDAEKRLRELQRKRRPHPHEKAEITALEARLAEYRVYGWTTSESNLATLPETAPEAAKSLARWLLLSNRVSTLQTWLDAYDDRDGRIHGSFNHIGAWTHRMSHDRPNMGNIPKFDEKQPDKTPYSDRMRALWRSSRDRLLVGVDAESIQLRVFGHYINDKNFINALVSGRKEDGTDPHSLNKTALGDVCKSRDAAKTFIYAWLLGAGIEKVGNILDCSKEQARRANDDFIAFYPGLAYLKEEVIPEDAARGYFRGFDGRFVRIWGDDVRSREHFTLAGYLQTGETVVMKRAVQIWEPKLIKEGIPFWPVNFVHDEWQVETVEDMDVAKYVAETMADSIRLVGLELGLNCPMAGSILNSHGELAIGDNWMVTH